MHGIYLRILLVHINALEQTHLLPYPEMLSQTEMECLSFSSVESPSWMLLLEDKADNFLVWHIYFGNKNALLLKTKQGKRDKSQ